MSLCPCQLIARSKFACQSKARHLTELQQPCGMQPALMTSILCAGCWPYQRSHRLCGGHARDTTWGRRPSGRSHRCFIFASGVVSSQVLVQWQPFQQIVSGSQSMLPQLGVHVPRPHSSGHWPLFTSTLSGVKGRQVQRLWGDCSGSSPKWILPETLRFGVLSSAPGRLPWTGRKE